jgi:uncharacterized integral membrane protein
MTRPAEESRPDGALASDGTDGPDASAGRPTALPQHVVTPTRFGAVWVAAIGFAVVLLLLLIFILQNSQRIDVSFFGVHGHLPLGVALLLAAVFGVLLVVVPGIGRMTQLRLAARRHRRIDAARTPPETTSEPDAGAEQ